MKATTAVIQEETQLASTVSEQRVSLNSEEMKTLQVYQ